MAAANRPDPKTNEAYWRKVYLIILGFELIVILLLYWFSAATT